MESIIPEYNLDALIKKNHRLEEEEKITFLDLMFSNGLLRKLQDYHTKLRKILKTSDKTQPIDSDYYRNLLIVQDGKLKESYITQDDPFYPIFKFVEDITVLYNHLEESPALDKLENISHSSFFRSILSYRQDFLSKLNMSMCGRYSFKLIQKNFRTYVKPDIKNRIDNMILKHIDIQQDWLNVNLFQDQKILPEFISSTATYEALKMSYNEFCVDENNMEDMMILNHNNDEIDTNLKSETGDFDKRLHFVPKELNPEARAFEQNSLGEISLKRKPRDVGSDNILREVSHMSVGEVSSNAFSIYAYLPLLFISIFILMSFFKVKKII